MSPLVMISYCPGHLKRQRIIYISPVILSEKNETVTDNIIYIYNITMYNIVFRASKHPVNDVKFYFAATENPWKYRIVFRKYKIHKQHCCL